MKRNIKIILLILRFFCVTIVVGELSINGLLWVVFGSHNIIANTVFMLPIIVGGAFLNTVLAYVVYRNSYSKNLLGKWHGSIVYTIVYVVSVTIIWILTSGYAIVQLSSLFVPPIFYLVYVADKKTDKFKDDALKNK